jgi:hypothetical protein
MVLACASGGAMSFLISIVQLESAINLARKHAPSLDYVLHPDVNALAEIYGRMIYQKTTRLILIAFRSTSSWRLLNGCRERRSSHKD